jgi:hypothetical protein
MDEESDSESLPDELCEIHFGHAAAALLDVRLNEVDYTELDNASDDADEDDSKDSDVEVLDAKIPGCPRTAQDVAFLTALAKSDDPVMRKRYKMIAKLHRLWEGASGREGEESDDERGENFERLEKQVAHLVVAILEGKMLSGAAELEAAGLLDAIAKDKKRDASESRVRKTAAGGVVEMARLLRKRKEARQLACVNSAREKFLEEKAERARAKRPRPMASKPKVPLLITYISK